MAKSRYKSADLERFHDFVAEQGCLVCGWRDAETGKALVHHVRGYADKPGCISKDHWLVTPLCPPHHDVQHGPRTSVHALSHQGFFREYQIDLYAEAMRLAETYQRKDAA